VNTKMTDCKLSILCDTHENDGVCYVV
jgi:hypothetical protein